MPLPTDTRGEATNSADYFKPEKGQNKILIVGEPVIGYEYWTEDNKVHRSPNVFESTPGIRQVTKKDKDGKETKTDDKQKYFWVLPVYDYADSKIKVFQVNQKGIRDALLSFQTNEDWGNPIGNYSITITREGEKLSTKYTVTPNPAKEGDKVIAEATKLYKENPIDVDALMFSAPTEDGEF